MINAFDVRVNLKTLITICVKVFRRRLKIQQLYNYVEFQLQFWSFIMSFFFFKNAAKKAPMRDCLIPQNRFAVPQTASVTGKKMVKSCKILTFIKSINK